MPSGMISRTAQPNSSITSWSSPTGHATSTMKRLSAHGDAGREQSDRPAAHDDIVECPRRRRRRGRAARTASRRRRPTGRAARRCASRIRIRFHPGSSATYSRRSSRSSSNDCDVPGAPRKRAMASTRVGEAPRRSCRARCRAGPPRRARQHDSTTPSTAANQAVSRARMDQGLMARLLRAPQ